MDLERVFFSLTHSLPYSVVLTDGSPEDPRVVFVNAAFEKMTGYSIAEMRGKNPKILQGERTEREVLDRLKECLRQRKSFKGATFNYRKCGEEFLLKWCIRPFSVNEKEFFVALQQDLTAENSDERKTMTDEFVVSLTQNLTAFYRNSLMIYQQLHEMLREDAFDSLSREEVFNALQIRDSVTMAAADLTDYLIGAGMDGRGDPPEKR